MPCWRNNPHYRRLSQASPSPFLHRSYCERLTISQERHYLQVMVYGDCHRKLRELMERHNLSASGAAHHLIRLGAGLAPLPPLQPQDTAAATSAPAGEEPRP